MTDVAQRCVCDQAGELHLISAITPLRPQRFLRRREINDISGNPVAVLEPSPPVFANCVVNHFRNCPELDQVRRHQALQQASELFRGSVLCGMSLEDYHAKVCALTGLPRTVVERASHKIAASTTAALSSALKGIPCGVPRHESQINGQKGYAQSVRRGDVLAVIAPGNGTGVHALWPQAIALGYRVVLRPSEREPLTAQRLIAAMAAAGLQDYVALLPCEHDVTETLIDAADLSLIYGGEALTARFAHRNDILVQGPGRSKIVIGADYPQDRALALVMESVLGLGGAACVCTSSVMVEGDAAAFARAFCLFVWEKMKCPRQREEWLARLSAQRFSWWREQVAHYAPVMVETPVVFEAEGDTHQVMPLVMQASALTDPLVQLELPVASVTFLSFSQGDDLRALAPALVVTVASGNKQLIDAVEQVSGIRNLYIGDVPTIWMHPDVPHDGYLAEFLMTTRGCCTREPDCKPDQTV